MGLLVLSFVDGEEGDDVDDEDEDEESLALALLLDPVTELYSLSEVDPASEVAELPRRSPHVTAFIAPRDEAEGTRPSL